MFAIGEAETQVISTKVTIPKEYNLTRKGRKIMGVWIGDYCLYLSDEEKSLKAKAGKNGSVIPIHIYTESKIEVPSALNNMKVKIQGCITTIELRFITPADRYIGASLH